MSSLDPKEKSAAIQLFELKRHIRNKVDEFEATANTLKSEQSKKWYRYFALELENILREALMLERKFPPLS